MIGRSATTQRIIRKRRMNKAEFAIFSKMAAESSSLYSHVYTPMELLEKASNAPSTPSRLSALPMATPLTVQCIRQLCKSSSSRQKEALLQRAVLRLATKFDIQTFENKGLRKALTQKKKRRQRGKRLNFIKRGGSCGALILQSTTCPYCQGLSRG
jgi:hypothetical protein